MASVGIPPQKNGLRLFDKKDIKLIVDSEGAQFAPATLQVQACNHQTDFQRALSHFNDGCLLQLIVDSILKLTFQEVWAKSNPFWDGSSKFIVGYSKSITITTAKIAPNISKHSFQFIVVSKSRAQSTIFGANSVKLIDTMSFQRSVMPPFRDGRSQLIV